jgi:hypothetical protein
LLFHETLDLLIDKLLPDYHTINMVYVIFTPSSLSKDCTQIIYDVALATDLYSASVLDLEIAPVEQRSSTQPAQSTSEKALTNVEFDFMKVRPKLRV